jgi:hypothetical protein
MLWDLAELARLSMRPEHPPRDVRGLGLICRQLGSPAFPPRGLACKGLGPVLINEQM